MVYGVVVGIYNNIKKRITQQRPSEYLMRLEEETWTGYDRSLGFYTPGFLQRHLHISRAEDPEKSTVRDSGIFKL